MKAELAARTAPPTPDARPRVLLIEDDSDRGQEIRLTPRGFALFRSLAERSGR